MSQEIFIAIIAAISALSGVLISQIITLFLSFSDKKHKRQVLLRQKYEEMIFQFQDSLSYYNDVATCNNHSQLLQMTHSLPAQRVRGLALLYFPELVPFIDTYINCYVSYYQFVVSLYDPNNPASAGTQARQKSLALPSLQSIETSVFSAKDELLEEIIKNAKKYTKV